MDKKTRKLRESLGYGAQAPRESAQRMFKAESERLQSTMKWLTRYFITFILGFAILIFASANFEPDAGNGYGIALGACLSALIIGGNGFLICLGSLAARLRKSPVKWVGLSLLFGPVGIVVAYFRMRILVSESIVPTRDPTRTATRRTARQEGNTFVPGIDEPTFPSNLGLDSELERSTQAVLSRGDRRQSEYGPPTSSQPEIGAVTPDVLRSHDEGNRDDEMLDAQVPSSLEDGDASQGRTIMNLSTAIVIASMILACGFVLGNLHKLDTEMGIALRINTVTGTVSVCGRGKCEALSE